MKPNEELIKALYLIQRALADLSSDGQVWGKTLDELSDLILSMQDKQGEKVDG